MAPRDPVVGIDLGTTFSVVACLDAQGRPVTIPNAEGDLITPSAVFLDEDSFVVGKEAVKAAALEPDRVAQFVKRDMGKPVFSRGINGEFYPPEVIQSLILEKLKRDAEEKIGPLKDVVITVPAYFNEPRRKATQDAGRLAGLNVLDIINEPTAAALAFGTQGGFLTPDGHARQAEKILVYDLGGGTFDASVLMVEGRNYRVLATDGNVQLGGIDWDQQIVDFLARQFQARHQTDPRRDPQARQRLLREAEDAKRALSARTKVAIAFEHGGRGVREHLTRSQFEEMTAHLLERTRLTLSSLLQQAGLRWNDLARILLVGGSTRMPMVAQMLEKESGLSVDRTLAADEVVAHGAAIYAGLLRAVGDGTPQDVQVTNVNSHNLGVLGIERATGRKRNQVMIPKNTALPATHTRRFQTRKANQRSVAVRVVEGGDPSGHQATPIGRCVVHDLPGGLPAATPVDVTFSYVANGRLTVRADLPTLGKRAQLDIERSSGLSESRLTEWGHRVAAGLKPLNLDSGSYESERS